MRLLGWHRGRIFALSLLCTFEGQLEFEQKEAAISRRMRTEKREICLLKRYIRANSNARCRFAGSSRRCFIGEMENGPKWEWLL